MKNGPIWASDKAVNSVVLSNMTNNTAYLLPVIDFGYFDYE